MTQEIKKIEKQTTVALVVISVAILIAIVYTLFLPRNTQEYIPITLTDTKMLYDDTHINIHFKVEWADKDDTYTPISIIHPWGTVEQNWTSFTLNTGDSANFRSSYTGAITFNEVEIVIVFSNGTKQWEIKDMYSVEAEKRSLPSFEV